jgi:hypothetical protein
LGRVFFVETNGIADERTEGGLLFGRDAGGEGGGGDATGLGYGDYAGGREGFEDVLWDLLG